MNKIFSIIMMLIAAVAFTACSSEGIGEDNGTDPITKSPSTKVLVNGSAASATFSSALLEESVVSTIERKDKNVNPKIEPGYLTPDENGQHNAFFYIRIDGNVPIVGTAVSEEYIPLTAAKKTLYNYLNMGHAAADAPWREGSMFKKYLYATDGIAVESALSEIPTIDDLVKANKNTAVAKELLEQIEEMKDDLHIIWYTCKLQTNDSWHVDGILTTKDITNVDDTSYGDELEEKRGDRENDKVVESDGDGEVEVDIHHQEHQNWNEIKTSIHIRENANVRVTIPVGKEFVEEADDFAIRTYEVFIPGTTETTEVDGAKIKVTVKHTTNNIVIEVTGVTKEIIDQLKAASEDGLTIEVHNYIKDILSNEDINEAIKNSKVETFKPEKDSDKLRAPLNTYIYGQITNYNDKTDVTPIGGKDQKRHMADKDNVAPAATETEN